MLIRQWLSVLILLGGALPLAAQSVADPYLRHSLVFEPNQGQADASVKFISKGNGFSFLLSETEATLAFSNSGTSLRMKLAGQSPKPVIKGVDLQKGVSHYYLGSDPSRWRSSVPQFAKVKYTGVYPGVDVVYYSSERHLEYDFEVAPHVDPSTIKIEFEGAQTLSLGAEGDLILATAAGEIRHRRPIAYQVVDGSQRAVDARFVLRGDRVEFALGRYDRRLPLVIDPKLVWGSFWGGNGNDQGNDVVLDAAGNVYVGGITQYLQSDAPLGVLVPADGSVAEVFVSKIGVAGDRVYTVYFGGTGVDEGHSLALDSFGNIYVTGYTTSTDLPILGGFQNRLGGAQDAYLAKFDNDGALLYSTYIGGTRGDRGYGLAVDAAGNAYIAGNTLSTNFPILNAFQPRFGSGQSDAFLTCISAGGILAFSTYFGGFGIDHAYDVVLGTDGSIVLTGFTTSPNFPVVNAISPNPRGGDDIFVTKFIPSGGSLVFSTYFGGSGADDGVRLAVDQSNYIYVTGYTSSLDFPVNNAPQAVNVGVFDAFLIKMSPDGQEAPLVTYIGGEDVDSGVGIAVDSSGFIYLAGYTSSFRFYSINAVDVNMGGLRDGFVMKLAPDATAVHYSTYLGGFSLDGATSIAVDGSGAAYVTGYTVSTDFPLSDNPIQDAVAGAQDGFIAKITSDDVKAVVPYVFPAAGGFSVSTAGQSSTPFFGFATADVAGSASLAGLAVIDIRNSGRVVNEVSIPSPRLTMAGRLLVRTFARESSAISIVNPNSEDVTINFHFTNTDGTMSHSGTTVISARQQLSVIVTAAPFSFPVENHGTMTFTASAPVAAVGLLVNSAAANLVNLYLPVVDPATANNTPVVVPQFVDGEGWTTELVLVNPTDNTITGEIRLTKNDSSGSGIPADVETSHGTASVFSYSIPSQSLYRLVSQKVSASRLVGHADIVPDSGSMTPLAFAHLYSDAVLEDSDEQALSVSVVEGIAPAGIFRVYAELTGSFPDDNLATMPALAVANSSTSTATVNISLRGFDGTDSGLSAVLTIPPKGHVSAFLNQIPGFTSLPASPYKGVLTLTTAQPGVTVAGFRARYNEKRQFLFTTTGPLKDVVGSNPVVFPNLTDGGGYATQFILIDLAGSAAGGDLRFFNPLGTPRNLSTLP